MKDFHAELINPISYTREFKAPRKENIGFKRRAPLTKRELLTKLVNTTYNKKHSNGRIYAPTDDGSYSSHSVSPYCESFWDNIEEGIKPLVLAFKNKNYLSTSSCEGHNIYFKRYVTLAFPSQESALELKKQLQFKRLKFKLNHCSEVLNNRITHNKYGEILKTEKIESTADREDSIEYMNTMIKRNYAEIWLLEIIISDQIEHEEGWKKYLKNWREIIFKKFFIKSFTNKLTKFITNKLTPNIY